METFYGEITPALIAGVIAFIAQRLKVVLKFEGIKADLLVLGLSYLVMSPYQVIVSWMFTPPATDPEVAWLVFKACFYPIMSWVMSAGFYNKLATPGQALE